MSGVVKILEENEGGNKLIKPKEIFTEEQI